MLAVNIGLFISATELLAGIAFYAMPHVLISDPSVASYASVRATRLLGCACLALGITSVLGLLSSNKKVKKTVAFGLASYHLSVIIDGIAFQLFESAGKRFSSEQINETLPAVFIHVVMLVVLIPAMFLSTKDESVKKD